MSIAKSLVILSIAVLIVSTILYFTQEDLTAIGDFSFVITSLIAAVLLWMAARSVYFKDERKVWTMLAIAATGDFIGESLWAYYEVIEGIPLPSPSLADVAWIIAYLLFIYAVWLQVRMLFEPAKKLAAALTVGSIALLLLTYAFVKSIAGGITFETIIDFIYPYLDIIQITLTVLVLMPLLKVPTKLSKPWLLICVAYITFFIYDFGYAYLSTFEQYYTGDYVDIVYILAYVITGIAGYYRYQSMEVSIEKVVKH